MTRAPGLALLCAALALCAAPVHAQPPSSARSPARWLDLQTLTLSTRYRAIKDSAGRMRSNELQERTQLRARLKLDPAGRYALHVGVFTGSSFTSGWNSTGLGTGEATASHSLKQLFASALPFDGLELQYGSLYPARGESTEITTFDEDAYLSGGRVTLRRADLLFVDELTVSIASLGALDTPGVTSRWDEFGGTNYRQLQVTRRLHAKATASFDYSWIDGVNWIRPSIVADLAAWGIADELRLEIYRRDGPDAETGYALAAERQLAGWLRLTLGYIDVDMQYGRLNGDRYFSGKRAYVIAAIPITRELNLQFFTTHAVGNNPFLPNHVRSDVVVSYAFAPAIRRML